nr:hypothetical protein [Nocardia canadensis]
MISAASPARRALVTGLLGSWHQPRWSMAADTSCWPVTVSAMVVAAPICGMTVT